MIKTQFYWLFYLQLVFQFVFKFTFAIALFLIRKSICKDEA